nr:MAG TPA: hypothetical protein [Herelleviridae sp.]
MLKLLSGKCLIRVAFQPPSGGCVLKHLLRVLLYLCLNQPPSGGCVLKLCDPFDKTNRQHQPPSGGCVLKPLPSV